MKNLSVQEKEKKIKIAEQKLAERKKILRYEKQIEDLKKDNSDIKRLKKDSEEYQNLCVKLGTIISYLNSDIHKDLKNNGFNENFNQSKMIELLKNSFNYFSQKIEQKQA